MHSSKRQTKPAAPSYLESAIQNLSNLLSESPEISQNPQEKNPSFKEIEVKDEEIDKYTSLLSEKLLKIQEELIKEESLLFKAQEENIELKAKWSEEVKKQENTVKLGKAEIIKLSDQNKELVSELHMYTKQRQTLAKELQKIESETQKISQEIDKKTQQFSKSKDENELNQQVDSLKSQLNQESLALDSQERKLAAFKKQIIQLNTANEELDKQIFQIKDRLSRLEREKSCGNDKKSKFFSDYKAALLKKNQLSKKIEELEIIDQKFIAEIALKNQQMELGRRKNQVLEVKKIKFENLLAQIALENDLNLALKAEKMRLLQLSQALILDKRNFEEKDVAKSDSCSAFSKNTNENIENFIENLRNEHKKLEHCYDGFLDIPLEKFEEFHEILEENIKLEDKIQEIELKLAEKKVVLEEILKEKENYECEIGTISQKFENNKLEKNNILEKYASLEHELRELSAVKQAFTTKK